MAKVLISMREDFLDDIDEFAEQEHRSRSELIREALRMYMGRRNKKTNLKQELLDSLMLD